ncbi:DDE-type integrase/transposase/recombinase [Aneurinibacillus migulanus]|uniref:DDE-type integrase/transposase/recombinase n=1 Tax=Aneurinibacillus migulanus TaxID=47500 RepID=UPI0009C06382|nr:DDE-type integrase/transposase/recombinase [Aneurinibacillus migulanus]
MDVYDRSIVAYHIGLRYEAKDVVRTLQQALFKRQLFDKEDKPVLRSDNGPQFISHAFKEACESFGITHERIPPSMPNMNAHIESFHRILEEDCLSRYKFESYKQAYETVVEFMTFYINQENAIKIKEVRV